MRIALHTPIAASRKEPLAQMTARIRQAFLDAQLEEPLVCFTFTDAAGKAGASLIDRVLKRHPAMERFVTEQKLGNVSARMISNVLSGVPADFDVLEAIASGVPRSYPFPSIAFHFYAADFGERLIGLPALGHSYPGVLITDSWWVSGRQRAVSVYTVVEASDSDKKLPPSPPRLEALIKSCGKAKKTVQIPILAPTGGLTVSIPPANLDKVKAVIADYRSRSAEIADAARMPHVLPPTAQALTANLGVLAGPRKPALEAAFKPLGYSCLGGSGIFHLTRRTEANHTAELYLDVGTWSHMVSASFLVHGPGFRATFPLPIAPGIHGQYPIGDAAQWQKIIENLQSLVRELERTFVPAIDTAAGPAPAWFDPRS